MPYYQNHIKVQNCLKYKAVKGRGLSGHITIVVFVFWPSCLNTLSSADGDSMLEAQNKELSRGPLNYFSPLVYRGSSHRRKSAACAKFDMVWLNLSPIPVGRRGVISSFS